MAPWYVIAWRLLWAGPLWVAFLMAVVVLAVMYGPREARHFWRENV